MISGWDLHRRSSLAKVAAGSLLVLLVTSGVLLLAPRHVVTLFAIQLWGVVLAFAIIFAVWAGAWAYLGPSSGWPGSWSLRTDIDKDRMIAVVVGAITAEGVAWERKEPAKRPRIFRPYETPFVLEGGIARVWIAEVSPRRSRPPSSGASQVTVEPLSDGYDSERLRTRIVAALKQAGKWETFEQAMREGRAGENGRSP